MASQLVRFHVPTLQKHRTPTAVVRNRDVGLGCTPDVGRSAFYTNFKTTLS